MGAPMGMGMNAQRANTKDTGILPYHLAWNEAERLNQYAIVCCIDCPDFRATDCLYLARRRHREHRLELHPERKSTRKTRKRPGFSMSNKSLEENLAASRKSGATSWDGAAA